MIHWWFVSESEPTEDAMTLAVMASALCRTEPPSLRGIPHRGIGQRQACVKCRERAKALVKEMGKLIQEAT